MRVHICKWEHLDPSVKLIRKQEEYNQALEQCNSVIVMFHKRIGKFTREEFEKAKLAVKNDNIPTNRIKVCFVDEVYRSVMELTEKEKARVEYHYYLKSLYCPHRPNFFHKFNPFGVAPSCASSKPKSQYKKAPRGAPRPTESVPTLSKKNPPHSTHKQPYAPRPRAK